ncbi:sulfiredoxin [Arabidopsis thaliana]|uniref:sulfiredoxin n=1 Tax=Arabidopsis thaliana TaxID=3702 RepID=F4I7W2_ARATH|nr:sulfiredoxin [Arabidopsis thaliana]AEE31324.1 sulfiredoxin [Arabidopsis thaliana]|eukprot:NP_001185121.1 sulfiredoxin [Arabidopsis thaliana]
MANLMMRLPISLRSFSVSASSSNGSPPVIGGSSGGVGPMIVELPLEKIRRPLMRTRSNDQNKVKELMDSIRQIGLQVPIDVIEVDGTYYGFSGCHRYEAHQKLGLPTIRCKIRKGTKETLRSSDWILRSICTLINLSSVPVAFCMNIILLLSVKLCGEGSLGQESIYPLYRTLMSHVPHMLDAIERSGLLIASMPKGG